MLPPAIGCLLIGCSVLRQNPSNYYCKSCKGMPVISERIDLVCKIPAKDNILWDMTLCIPVQFTEVWKDCAAFIFSNISQW